MKIVQAGERIGRLVVLGPSPTDERSMTCACDCGAVTERKVDSLLEAKRLNRESMCGACVFRKGKLKLTDLILRQSIHRDVANEQRRRDKTGQINFP